MSFLKRREQRKHRLSVHAEDPMNIVANLFDVAMVFAVGLMVAIVSAYHLHELLSAEDFTLLKNPNQPGQMEIISKEGKKIKAQKLTKEMVEGQGIRLGVAYKLLDGRVVYIPEGKEGE